MVTIERYDGDERRWNEFVATSRNGTFLFDRRYMDYHSDRFADNSLVAYDSAGKLLALLPACREGDTLYSHRGLTYGGWIMPARRCDAIDMLTIWDAMTGRLRDEGLRTLVYKPVPHIYHRQPAEEDLYAIFRAGGVTKATLVSSVINLSNPLPMDQGSRQRARKAVAAGVTCAASDDWPIFWAALEQLLMSRYGAKPVHSLAEITMLAGRFPDNIRLYTATSGGRLLAGVVIYVTDTVIHSQYTAATPEGKEMSVLPALYSFIIEQYRGRAGWFDFGTSNEHDGRAVNEGLLRQKCSYGGRAVVYNSYEISI